MWHPGPVSASWTRRARGKKQEGVVVAPHPLLWPGRGIIPRRLCGVDIGGGAGDHHPFPPARSGGGVIRFEFSTRGSSRKWGGGEVREKPRRPEGQRVRNVLKPRSCPSRKPPPHTHTPTTTYLPRRVVVPFSTRKSEAGFAPPHPNSHPRGCAPRMPGMPVRPFGGGGLQEVWGGKAGAGRGLPQNLGAPPSLSLQGTAKGAPSGSKGARREGGRERGGLKQAPPKAGRCPRPDKAAGPGPFPSLAPARICSAFSASSSAAAALRFSSRLCRPGCFSSPAAPAPSLPTCWLVVSRRRRQA